MKKIDKYLVEVLIEAGFVESGFVKDMFFTRNEGDIKQIFFPSFIRKMGSVRFDGYIGLYFLEFENKWNKSRDTNPFYLFRLPIFGISISNFLDLSYKGVFHYTDNKSDLLKSAKNIYDKCRELPASKSEITRSFEDGRIIGRNFSDYINIYEESYENNARLLKLANFLRWVIVKYDLPEDLYDTLLDRHQLTTIKRIPEDFYYVG